MQVVLPRTRSTKPSAGAEPNRGHSLLREMRGWWPFLECGGDTAYDLSGNNHDATLTSMVPAEAWVAGTDRFGGYALKFDGANDHGVIGALGFTRASGEPLSAAAWVTSEENTGSHRVAIGCRNGSGAGDLWKLGKREAQWRFEYDPVGPGGNVEAVNIVLDEWTHICGVYDGSDLILYVNGQRAGNTASTTAAIDQDNYAIGRRSDSAAELWKGKIDGAMVWSRDLSADEVLQLYINPWRMFPSHALRVGEAPVVGADNWRLVDGMTGQDLVDGGLAA